MKRLSSIAATLVICASISSANAQEEEINIIPSSLDTAASVEATFIAPKPQPGSILLLDGRDHNGHRALDIFDYTYTEASADELVDINFDAFDIIYMPWIPYQEMINALNARKADLKTWLEKGGGIVVNAEWKPDVVNPYSFLPVNFDTASGGYHTNGVHIVQPTHPLVEGLTDALLGNWGNSVHGKITAYPPEATVVATATSYDSPHIIGMCHKGGKIVVTTADPEWHTVHNYYGGDGPAKFLYNELKWVSTRDCVIPVDVEGYININTILNLEDHARFKMTDMTDLGEAALENDPVNPVDLKFTIKNANDQIAYEFAGDGTVYGNSLRLHQEAEPGDGKERITCNLLREECLIAIDPGVDIDEDFLDNPLTICLEVNGTLYCNTGDWNEVVLWGRTVYRPAPTP